MKKDTPRLGPRNSIVSILSACLLVAACSSGSGSESEPGDPASSSGDAAAPSASTLEMARIAHDEAVFGGESPQTMQAVTHGGPGFVAVGWDELLTPRAAAVWTSTDGESWTRVAHDETVFGGPALMWDVAAGDAGLVAVGRAGGGLSQSAAVWTSPDGTSWSRVPHDEAIFSSDERAWMNAVTVGGPGFVAVGGISEPRDAAVWTSVDGTSWTRVPHDDAVFGGADTEEMFGVTTGGPGLVAVGTVTDANPSSDTFGESDAVVWTSVDGLTWTRLDDVDGVFGGEDVQAMADVVSTGQGLVAVGTDWNVEMPPDAAVWTSSDGASWSRVSHDAGVFGGASYQQMLSVSTTGDGLVAVGLTSEGDTNDDAAVWTSSDGASWARVPHDDAVFGGPDDQKMLGVASDGSTIVAVGIFGPIDDTDAAVWIGGN